MVGTCEKFLMVLLISSCNGKPGYQWRVRMREELDL